MRILLRELLTEGVEPRRRSPRSPRSPRSRPRPYSGPDRRRVIAVTETRGVRLAAIYSLCFVVVLPLVASGVASWAGVAPQVASGRIWSSIVVDTAFSLLVVDALLLFIRWRLTGDAMAVSVASVAGLMGALLVPVASQLARQDTHVASYAGALFVATAAVLVCVSIWALRSPDVRAGLHPVSSTGLSIACALGLAPPLAFSSMRLALTFKLGGVGIVYLAEAIAAALVALVLCREGLKRRRVLLVGLGAAVLSVTGACDALAGGVGHGSGVWSELPALFLLSGALALGVFVSRELHSAINAVVLHDVRGRRRWEAAETELTEVRTSHEGKDHDITSMLSAVDGTLFVLSTQRDHLPGQQVDRLMLAVRDQVDTVRRLLAKQACEGESYDVGALIGTVLSLRSCESDRVSSDLETGLVALGRRDRLALVLNNLLANAASHAPGASVVVSVRRIAPDQASEITGPFGALEIRVSDDGPGMSDADMRRALERGWRGGTEPNPQGSGLGLYQCRELLNAEGGTISLAHADASAEPGRRGLEVRIRVPAGALSRHGVTPRPS